MSSDLHDAVYVVISEAEAKIAVAETTFLLLDNPPFHSWHPLVRMVTRTEEELALLDQFLLGRAAYGAEHVDDLPYVDYPDDGVFVGAGDYQLTSELFMNGHPAVTVAQLEEELVWGTFLSRVSSVWNRVAGMLAGEVFRVYIRLDFHDGSYGVFIIKDTTTAGVHPVYYVDKDGNLTVIDESLMQDVDDPNITDPDVTGMIDDVLSEEDATYVARAYPAGTGGYFDDVVVIYLDYSGSGRGGVTGRVFVGEVPDEESE
jgi:hypothetical protein